MYIYIKSRSFIDFTAYLNMYRIVLIYLLALIFLEIVKLNLFIVICKIPYHRIELFALIFIRNTLQFMIGT